jgi:RluA family pseudouridine synthase
MLKGMVEARGCLVNGLVVIFSSHKLMKGDVVELVESIIGEKGNDECQILFEDEDLLVINKSASIVSDAKHIATALSLNKPIQLIHRLDKDTSGLLMLAKNNSFFQMIKELFQQKRVHKYYVALLDGKMTRKRGVIDNFLAPQGGYEGQTLYGAAQDGHGLRAITGYCVLAEGEKCCLALLEPRTGRTHQLRVHMKEMGHPILGDFQYARQFVCPHHPLRQMLHAYALHFIHPKTAKPLFLTAALPGDILQCAEKIKVSLDVLAGLTSLQEVTKRLQR